MINYFDLFETLYSNLPESAKLEVLENISEEFSKSINESEDKYKPILEVLDILAYSKEITEEKANAIIDELFLTMDSIVVQEILESFIKEKSIEYITELLAHGTDAIGLAGLRKEKAQKDEQAQKAQARKQAINNAIGNTITKARETKERAITGAREATERMGAKAKEVKEKAVSGIKSAVGKVKDWAKKATEPSAKEYAYSIGNKANKLKVKPGSYADKYAKSLKKQDDSKVTPEPVKQGEPKNEPEKVADNPVKVSAKKTKVTKTKKEKVAKTSNTAKVKKEKQPKVNKTSEKATQDAGDRIHNEVKDYIAQADKEQAERDAKEKQEVEARKERSEKVLKGNNPETEKEETKETEKNKVENASKVQSKSEGEKAKSNLSPALKKAMALASYRSNSNQEGKDLQRTIKTYEDRLESMKSKPGYSSDEISALEKKIENLKNKASTNESLADFITLLLRTNISESAFIEVIRMTNPIKKKEDKKKKFEEIAKNALNRAKLIR